MMQGLNLTPEMLHYLQQMQQQGMQQPQAPMGMPTNAQQQGGMPMPLSYQLLAGMLAQNQTPGVGSLMGMMRGLNSPY